MTLIAAFRCAEDSVVLCADSQETVDIPDRGQYRVNVNKLNQRDAGAYEVIVGGAGDGALVDGFADQFAESVRRWRGAPHRGALNNIRRFVRDYYRNDVALSRAHPDDKILGFVICLKHKATGSISLWRVVELHVQGVSDLALLGWEEPLYRREAERLYSLNGAMPAMPSFSEAILLGVHLFSIAKETSNYISGDTKVLVVRRESTRSLNASDVKELEARVKLFEHLTSMIFLALPDVTVTRTELTKYLREFQEVASQLHEQFMLHIAHTAFERIKGLPLDEAEDRASDPYLQLPSLEQIKKGLEEDEAILWVKKEAEAYHRQLETEAGWEELTSLDKRKLLLDLRNAAQALNSAAKLNRALYQAGQYGDAESREAIAARQAIAGGIQKANDQLIELIHAMDSSQNPQ